MRLNSGHLRRHLQEKLAPVYLVSGDEPFLLQEACDAIRAAARRRGFSEREVLHADGGFDWSRLLEAGSALSLFAEQRLLELRLAARPGKAGSEAIERYADRPPPDTVLLVISDKVDKSAQKSAWVKAVERAGAWVAIWPPDHKQLPGWVGQRMRMLGLEPDGDAVRILSERIEGNLLAATQEIEKLRLLHGPGPVDGSAVAGAVADSARFDVFQLADAVLLGDASRAARVLHGLRGEGVDPILILWALSREIRALATISAAVDQGRSEDRAMGEHRVWEKRKPVVRQALQRGGTTHWRGLLQRCLAVDRLSKGQAPGNTWDELLQLALATAGVATAVASDPARSGGMRPATGSGQARTNRHQHRDTHGHI